MTEPRVSLLVWQLDLCWSLFEYHASSLTDEECLWEPAPDAWTVRADAAGRWVADWVVPEPSPVPATTIGWLTWHVGFWWTSTHGVCFGSGAPDRSSIFWPGSASAAVSWLGSLKDAWRTALLEVSSSELDSTSRTAALPFGAEPLPLGQVAAWVNFELAKNVAEIGQTRHLYALKAASGAA
jgi:hypothetical protein